MKWTIESSLFTLESVLWFILYNLYGCVSFSGRCVHTSFSVPSSSSSSFFSQLKINFRRRKTKRAFRHEHFTQIRVTYFANILHDIVAKGKSRHNEYNNNKNLAPVECRLPYKINIQKNMTRLFFRFALFYICKHIYIYAYTDTHWCLIFTHIDDVN